MEFLSIRVPYSLFESRVLAFIGRNITCHVIAVIKNTLMVVDDSDVLNFSIFSAKACRWHDYVIHTQHVCTSTVKSHLMFSVITSTLSLVNSLTPRDAYMRHQSKPSLFQIMACCLFGAMPLYEPKLDYCQLGPWEHISMKYESKCNTFLWRKPIWKYTQNVGYFISASMYYSANTRRDRQFLT